MHVTKSFLPVIICIKFDFDATKFVSPKEQQIWFVYFEKKKHIKNQMSFEISALALNHRKLLRNVLFFLFQNFIYPNKIDDVVDLYVFYGDTNRW